MVQSNIEELLRRRAQQRAQSGLTPAQDIQGVPNSTPFSRQKPVERQSQLFTFKDTLAAPFRGIEGAVQDTYNFVDEVVFRDALADYDQRLLGESRTAVGGVIEGFSNFLTGFVPVVGVIGRIGKLGRAINLTTRAEKALRAAGRTRAALATRIGRDAAAGVIADFAVFDGHEERFSNFVQEYPVFANPVTELLAADEDDTEAEGRLKNAVEGLGLGLFADGLILATKSVRAMRRAREAGKSPAQVQEAMDEVAPPEELAQVFNRALDGDILEAARLANESERGAVIAAADAQARVGRALPDEVIADAPPIEPEFYTPRGRETRGTSPLEALEISKEDAETILQQIDEAPPAGTNPRDFTAAERMALELERRDLNLSRFDGQEGALAAIRIFEDLAEQAASKDVARLKRMGGLPQKLTERQEQAMQELADLAGAEPERLAVQLQRGIVPDGATTLAEQDLDALVRIGARVRMYDQLLVSATDNLYKHVDAVLKAPVGDEAAVDAAMADFGRQSEQLVQLTAAMKGIASEQGRAFRARRLPVGLLEAADLAQEVQSKGGRKAFIKAAEKLKMIEAAARGNKREAAAGALKATRSSTFRKFVNGTNEWWMFSLLSGFTTQAVNGLSGLATSVYLPFEQMLGGAATLRSEVVTDAVRQYVGLAKAIPDAFKMSWAAAKDGENILDPQMRTIDNPEIPQIGLRNLNPLNPEGQFRRRGEGESLTEAGLRWFRGAISLPRIGLTSGDEFVKQLRARSIAHAEFMKDALAEGVAGADAAAAAHKRMETLMERGQMSAMAVLLDRGQDLAVRQGLDGNQAREFAEQWAREQAQRPEWERLLSVGRRALEGAREATFTTPLQRGTLAGDFQTYVNRHPALRLVFPFIRTPTNIALFAGQRADAVGLAKLLGATTFPPLARNLDQSRLRLVQDALSNDPIRKSSAVGRLAFGGSFLTWGFAMAAAGNLTGQGPSDRAKRREWLDAGGQPYSIKVGDKHIAYGRIDPFATLLGSIADVVEVARWADEADQPELEKIVLGMTTALANNVTNKTYLSGVRDLTLLLDPSRSENQVRRTLGRFAGSFTVPSAAAQAARSSDPLMRELNGVLDNIRARIPGLSEELPPMRNLLGEPITRAQAVGSDIVGQWANSFVPIVYRETSDDVIRDELVNLNRGFNPPIASLYGVDLRTIRNDQGRHAYDRWLELHGKVKIGGRSLRSSLRQLIRNKSYQELSPVSQNGFDSPRAAAIGRVVSTYRRVAKVQMMREFPELAETERAAIRARREQSAEVGERGASFLGVPISTAAEALRGSPDPIESATQDPTLQR